MKLRQKSWQPFAGGGIWLDIPWMRALHGTANALGFGFTGVMAWHWSNNK